MILYIITIYIKKLMQKKIKNYKTNSIETCVNIHIFYLLFLFFILFCDDLLMFLLLTFILYTYFFHLEAALLLLLKFGILVCVY